MEANTFPPQVPLSFQSAQAAQAGVPRLALAYIYPHPQAGSAPEGMNHIVMPAAVYYQHKPPNYSYRPSDYKMLSILTIIICGFLSPPTLVLSIPALIFSIKSWKSANLKAIKQARRQGMISAYLNFTAITVALVVAFLLIGLIVGIQGRSYSLQQCIDRVRARNGGELPTTSSFSQRIRC